MIESMAIWLPLDVYCKWPVLLHGSCGTPNVGVTRPRVSGHVGISRSESLLRDDNSLIKALPRSLAVRTPLAGTLRGARMGTEFVAAHVWRVVNHALLASRLPLLNSFVPNLVWLPSQIAKLTDREEGVVQATFQSMAFAVYRHAPVAPHLEDVVEEAWALIPEPVPLTKPVSDSTRSSRRSAFLRIDCKPWSQSSLL